ncbi:hypothetical protein [Nocardiopsis baichengensis]|uniref:hypothetical protein n=1 Tax=Nocardiopsis baichengensis TaxID=280240 RepID=UPI000346F9C0|nr:hypothetical protein [Nocardiopsis baichengensis]
MKTVQAARKRGWRARPGWVLALAVVLALHYVCLVCMAAAASAGEVPAQVHTEAVAGKAVVADAPAEPTGAQALAPDAAHDDCDAPIINTAAYFGTDSDDSGVKSPADHRTASTALLLMLLLSAALAVVLRLPPVRRGAARAAVSRAAWRPSGIRLLTTLCIQRV